MHKELADLAKQLSTETSHRRSFSVQVISLQAVKARSRTGASPSVGSSRPTLLGPQVLNPRLLPQDGMTTQTAYVKLPVSGRAGEFQLEASWTGPGLAAEH
jgi:hypothetical protein